MSKPRRHIIIPDNQVHDGIDLAYLGWIGNYIAEKQPDVVVHLGDLADMPSLNGHAPKGGMEIEGQRVVADILAAREAVDLLVKPFRKVRNYKPQMVMCLGNHEDRLDRLISNEPIFEGLISTEALGYAEAGFTVYPFLEVVRIDDIEYSHYFQSGSMGKPVSSARALLALRHSSAIMGHKQEFDIAHHRQSDHIAIFAGACYPQDEPYLKPQGNKHRRQIVVLNEVHDGTAYPMFVSLKFLKDNYS